MSVEQVAKEAFIAETAPAAAKAASGCRIYDISLAWPLMPAPPWEVSTRVTSDYYKLIVPLYDGTKKIDRDWDQNWDWDQ